MKNDFEENFLRQKLTEIFIRKKSNVLFCRNYFLRKKMSDVNFLLENNWIKCIIYDFFQRRSH